MRRSKLLQRHGAEMRNDLLFDEIAIALMRLGSEPVRAIEPGAQMSGDRELRGIDVQAVGDRGEMLIRLGLRFFTRARLEGDIARLAPA